MKNILNKFGAAVLLFCTLFLLFSCGGGEAVKSGIDISDVKPDFSESTEKRSKEFFNFLIKEVYLSGGMPSVPPQKEKEIRELADRIWEITTDYQISEAQYNRIIDELIKNQRKFICIL